MEEIILKYGCNPNQTPARIFMENKKQLPIKILNGTASYINILDALNAWQLVFELKKATNFPAAASFKHVSPAGAAIGNFFNKTLEKICLVSNLKSKTAIAYAKARGADRVSSYGDFAALSDECDEETAQILKKEVSDGIIAPAYSNEALKILKQKKNGKYLIIEIDETFKPNEIERREVFGIILEQKRNTNQITTNSFENIVTENKQIEYEDLLNLTIATITAKYTQSNSICYAKNGMTFGIGAGQQSRIQCTKLAGRKSDMLTLKHHPKVIGLNFSENITRTQKDNLIEAYINEEYHEFLNKDIVSKAFVTKPEPLTKQEKDDYILKQSGLTLASDAFFPFSDNIIEARKHGVSFIAQPSGAIREKDVIETCNQLNMVMAITNFRLFHH